MNNRQSTRLKNFDYGSEGLYFVTILIKNRHCLLGEIAINNKDSSSNDILNKVSYVNALNPIGMIVEQEWLNTPIVRDNVALHDYIIMPNHIHGIIEITKNKNLKHPMTTFQSPSQTIGAIIRGFKIAVIKKLREQQLAKEYEILKEWDYKIWHRNYHDHIIKDTASYSKIVDYINDNPRRWLE